MGHEYRGPLAVHAGKKYDHEGHEFIQNEMGLLVPGDLPSGGIVGVVELLDCVDSYDSRWFFGPYGWVLGSPTPLSFGAYPGKLGLMEISDEFVVKLRGPIPDASALENSAKWPSLT